MIEQTQPVTTDDCIQLSKLAYIAGQERLTIQAARDEIRSWLPSSIADWAFNIYRNGPEACLIAFDHRSLVIAVTGTNERDDWVANVNTTTKRMSAWPGRIHSGFDAGADAVLVAIQFDLVKLAGSRQLILTGHSRGGAIATALAMKLAEQQINVSRIVTLGQPRVLNHEAAAHYDLQFNHLRLTNAGDSVPHCPSGIRFSHVGRQAYLRPDGTITRYSIVDLFLQSWHLVLSLVRLQTVGYLTTAHKTKTYLKKWRKAAARYKRKLP